MSRFSKIRGLLRRDRGENQQLSGPSSISSSANPTTSQQSSSSARSDAAVHTNTAGEQAKIQSSSSIGTPPASQPAVSLSSSQAAPNSTPIVQHGSSGPSPPPGVQKDFWDLAVQALQRDDSAAAERLTSVLSTQSSQAESIDGFSQLREMADIRRQKIEHDRTKIALGSRVYVIHDCLDKIIKTLSPLKEIATAAAGIDPVHVGLPVAAFCFLMETVSSNNQQFGAIVTGMVEIVPIVARWRSVEALFSLRQDKGLNQHFKESLTSLYSNVIRYQLAAITYFERGSANRTFRSIPKFDDVSEVLQAIKDDDAACDKMYQTFTWHDTQDILAGNQDIRADVAAIRLFLDNLKGRSNLIATNSSLNVHWMVTRVASVNFTGRSKLLTKLEATITDAAQKIPHNSQCHIVISGIGGQGKSEISLQVANRTREFFWGVFWVDVSTPLLAEAGFQKIAETIGHATQDWHRTLEFLASTQQPWLLILDNADDVAQDYQQYFPSGSSGVVILTSRNESCSHLATQEHFISLDSLSEPDAIQLLLRVSKIPDDRHKTLYQDALDVTKLLESHPLALIQAASYIAGKFCFLSEYPKVFQKNSRRLLSFRPRQAQARYKDVYATFEASAEALRTSDDAFACEALELLSTLATLGPRQIPVTIFQRAWKGARDLKADISALHDANEDLARTTFVTERSFTAQGLSTKPVPADEIDGRDIQELSQWHLSQLSPLLQIDSPDWDNFQLFHALNLLKSLALITIDGDDETLSISMHPLVHAWAMDRQELPERSQSWRRAACLLGMTVTERERSSRYETQVKPRLRVLMGTSLDQIFSYGPQLPMLQLVYALITLSFVAKDFEEHERLISQLFDFLHIDLESINPRWLTLYPQRAESFSYSGHHARSKILLEKTVNIHEELSPEDDHHFIIAQFQLARAYGYDGQYSRAVEVLEHVVRMRNESLAVEHPVRLSSQRELAAAYINNGQSAHALEILEPMVKIEAEALTEDNPYRLSALHLLGVAYMFNRQHRQALETLEYVVQVRQKLLPEDDENLLVSQTELSRICKDNGQLDRAIEIAEHVVKIRDHTLPQDHTSRVTATSALSTILWEHGQRERAMVLMKGVVASRKRTLAQDNVNRVRSVAWLKRMRVELDVENADDVSD